MPAEPFLSPKFVGERFDDHQLPMEFLRDLASLQDMIVAAARWKFHQRHPNRQRLPRNFLSGVSLNLSQIDDGSAIPVIVLSIAAGVGQLFHTSAAADYLTDARESIVLAIDAAATGKTALEYLPPTVLTHFDKVGRSLRDGELIEFRTPAHPAGAVLTKVVRHRLLRESATPTQYRDAMTIVGSLSEMDAANETFEVIIDGRKVRAPITSEFRQAVLESLSRYSADHPTVRLTGTGVFAADGRLEKIESVELLSEIDPLDVELRIKAIKSSPSSMLGNDAVPTSVEGLDWFSAAFQTHYDDSLQLPYLYPTPDGGLRAEWTLGRHELSLEVDLTTHEGYMHDLDTDLDSDSEWTLDLNSAPDWLAIMQHINALTGELM